VFGSVCGGLWRDGLCRRGHWFPDISGPHFSSEQFNLSLQEQSSRLLGSFQLIIALYWRPVRPIWHWQMANTGHVPRFLPLPGWLAREVFVIGLVQSICAA